VVDARLPPAESLRFKFAIIFLVISLIAGALGFTNISRVAKRISLVLFALFFLAFLALVGVALLVGEAISSRPAATPPPVVMMLPGAYAP